MQIKLKPDGISPRIARVSENQSITWTNETKKVLTLKNRTTKPITIQPGDSSEPINSDELQNLGDFSIPYYFSVDSKRYHGALLFLPAGTTDSDPQPGMATAGPAIPLSNTIVATEAVHYSDDDILRIMQIVAACRVRSACYSLFHQYDRRRPVNHLEDIHRGICRLHKAWKTHNQSGDQFSLEIRHLREYDLAFLESFARTIQFERSILNANHSDHWEPGKERPSVCKQRDFRRRLKIIEVDERLDDYGTSHSCMWALWHLELAKDNALAAGDRDNIPSVQEAKLLYDEWLGILRSEPDILRRISDYVQNIAIGKLTTENHHGFYLGMECMTVKHQWRSSLFSLAHFYRFLQLMRKLNVGTNITQFDPSDFILENPAYYSSIE